MPPRFGGKQTAAGQPLWVEAAFLEGEPDMPLVTAQKSTFLRQSQATESTGLFR